MSPDTGSSLFFIAVRPLWTVGVKRSFDPFDTGLFHDAKDLYGRITETAPGLLRQLQRLHYCEAEGWRQEREELWAL